MATTIQTTKPATIAKPKAAPTTKPGKAKVETKAKPAAVAKVETKPAETKAATPAKQEKKTPFALALYLAAKTGEFGELAKSFYQRADNYHKRAATVFPRQRTEFDRADMTQEKAKAIIKRASLGTLAAGAADGQALYDLMRMGADINK